MDLAHQDALAPNALLRMDLAHQDAHAPNAHQRQQLKVKVDQAVIVLTNRLRQMIPQKPMVALMVDVFNQAILTQ